MSLGYNKEKTIKYVALIMMGITLVSPLISPILFLVSAASIILGIATIEIYENIKRDKEYSQLKEIIKEINTEIPKEKIEEPQEIEHEITKTLDEIFNREIAPKKAKKIEKVIKIAEVMKRGRKKK